MSRKCANIFEIKSTKSVDYFYYWLRADDLAFMSFDSITFLGIDPFQFKILNDELYILKLFSLLSYHKMEQKNDIKKVLLPSTKGPPFESLATCSH